VACVWGVLRKTGGACSLLLPLQEYLDHKKTPPPPRITIGP